MLRELFEWGPFIFLAAIVVWSEFKPFVLVLSAILMLWAVWWKVREN